MDADGNPLPPGAGGSQVSATGGVDWAAAAAQAGKEAGANTRQGYVDAGIHNTSYAQNKIGENASVAATNAALAIGDRSYRAQNDVQAREDALRRERLNWLDSRNDTGPDMAPFYSALQAYGQGNQTGIDPQAYGGGGGGGGGTNWAGNAQSMGYGLPNMGFNWPQRQQRSTYGQGDGNGLTPYIARPPAPPTNRWLSPTPLRSPPLTVPQGVAQPISDNARRWLGGYGMRAAGFPAPPVGNPLVKF
jgi:hypothetical protein